MTDFQIYREIKMYFKIQELVGPRTYKKYGEKAWQFIDVKLLHALLLIRKGTGKPITVNNWHNGGSFSQRGLRSNLQQIFKGYFNRDILYLSGHVMGKAVDFDVQGMKAEEVRDWIVENEKIFPFKLRLEHHLKGKKINWVHLDVFYYEPNHKIYLFDV